jgi:hypothetical protein
MKSEFGRGLTYCLGLFLCHSERTRYEGLTKGRDIELWFNGAGDHLFDLEVPETLPVRLQRRLRSFQRKVLGWRNTWGEDKPPTKDDKKWAIKEAKTLLRLIDKHFGVKTQEGSWE